MRGLGRFHRPAAILQAHSLIAEQQAQRSAVGDVDVGGGDKCACFRGDGDAVGGDQIIMFAERLGLARASDVRESWMASERAGCVRREGPCIAAVCEERQT